VRRRFRLVADLPGAPGLPAVLEAYPNAKPVALPEPIGAMEEQVSPRRMQVWSAFFPGQLPEMPVVPALLPGTSIPIGDQVATVVPVGTTDTQRGVLLTDGLYGLKISSSAHRWHHNPRSS
jgi:hypothetical protein